MSNELWRKRLSQHPLRLSIFKPGPIDTAADHATGVGLLSLPGDPPPENDYVVSLCPCVNPRCGCFSILFRCVPAAYEIGQSIPAELVREFWIDLSGEKVTVNEGIAAKTESARLGERVQKALRDE